MRTQSNGSWKALTTTLASLMAFFGICWYTLAQVDRVKDDNQTLKTEVEVIKTKMSFALEGINDLKEAMNLPIPKKAREAENA